MTMNQQERLFGIQLNADKDLWLSYHLSEVSPKDYNPIYGCEWYVNSGERRRRKLNKLETMIKAEKRSNGDLIDLHGFTVDEAYQWYAQCCYISPTSNADDIDKMVRTG